MINKKSNFYQKMKIKVYLNFTVTKLQLTFRKYVAQTMSLNDKKVRPQNEDTLSMLFIARKINAVSLKEASSLLIL